MVRYCVIDDLATLVWAANLAALELHAPLAIASKPDRPTSMVFDLDPGAPATLIDCLRLGIRLRDRLKKIGLRSFAKTSGGKGLHLYVPLNTSIDFDSTKTFARAVADQLVADDPTHVTANMSKAQRGGKIFVDWSQNDTHKTTVCAYSLRAGQSPTVSTPITWFELESALAARDVERLKFGPSEALDRVEERGDAFRPVSEIKQKLPDSP
jgi:bifunctional non-homologous end joining protein LigD